MTTILQKDCTAFNYTHASSSIQGGIAEAASMLPHRTKPTMALSNTIYSHLYSRSGIHKPIQRLIPQRPEQLITQIRATTPQQAFKVFKRGIEIQPIG